MNKRKLITVLWSGITFTCLASGLLASIAWFASANKFDVDITGSVVEEYFHCGDGTAGPDDPETDTIEGPFVITRPIHYYHLVEFFQRETALGAAAEFGTDYLYFQVGYDLDGDGDLEVYDYDDQGIYQGPYETPSYSQTLNMAYYSGDNALMPIGTNEVPFIGVFDGKADEGIVISNLNIHCAETVVIEGTGTVNRAASDIGIFGYVADSDGSSPTIIQNLKVNGLTIDLTDVTSTVASPTTSIAHTDAHAGVAYVGYIAGHVHSYTNYSSTGPVNATPLHDVYVTNATITGGAGTSCGFGYIGLVDTVDGEEPSEVETQVTTAYTGGSGGQGDTWGGSVNMRSLNNRIWNLLNAPNNVRTDDPSTNHPSSNARTNDVPLQQSGKTYSGYSNYHRYYYDTYNYVTVENAVGESTYNNRNPETTSNIYRLAGDGTYTNYTKDDTRYKTIEVPGTALPLTVGEKADGYPTATKNTGYIVSGMAGGTGAYTNQTTIRVAASPIGAHIGNSLSSSGRDSTGYTQSQLEVITTSNPGNYSSSNFTRIQDKYNSSNTSIAPDMSSVYNSRGVLSSNLAKYDDAREQLDAILSGQSFSHGLHFTGSSISDSVTFSMPSATINGTTYTNYAMPKNSIDFNLKESGYINFFAGSYQHNTTNTCDSFFSLHVVKRNSSGGITSIAEISKIYNNTDASTKTEFPYVYELENSTYYAGMKNGSEVTYTKGSTVVFDMQYLWNTPGVDYAMYYFEVPVNAGEFAMGSHSGKDKGTYLLYLDLSANAAEEQETHNQTVGIANSALFSQVDFQISAPVTNSCFNVAFVIPNGATKETFSVTISSGTVTHEGEDYFCYEIVIVNTTQNDFTISALLVDDDDDPENDFYYMYAIKYNTGARTEYTGSNTYTGVSGGTTMTPTYAPPEQGEGD